MVLRFAGFELDRTRVELRGPGGDAIKLRPKTLSMLTLFAANAGRVLSKQELMDAVWPNLHVGDDSLFQCIRELRTALGDEQRQMIKLVSGHGYLFDVATREEQASPAIAPAAMEPDRFDSEAIQKTSTIAPFEEAPPPQPTDRRKIVALTASALGIFIVGAAIAVSMMASRRPAATGVQAARGPLTIAVMPIVATDDDSAAVVADVTTQLRDGLARIDNVRVMMASAPANSSGPRPDYTVTAEIGKRKTSWDARARMTQTATGDIVWTMPVSVARDGSDASLQQVRLTAGIGEPLAQRINGLVHAKPKPAADRASTALPASGEAKVVIEQAMASITQTSRERFAVSQGMLSKALADDPDNVDLAVALAAMQLRGVQMVWYTPAESAAAEVSAQAILERALKQRPDYLPVLEAYCRFLNATNQFVESLVACSRVLSFDPWNGMALFEIGIGQDQLGRFEDALRSFKQADQYDTPPISRWTWKLGAGMTYLLMRRSEDALPWLQSSIAITPASGRSYMLLAAAYQALGRPDEAKAAMAKALALRPNSNSANVALPTKNASASFLSASEWIAQAFVTSGLPEH
jgi:DNA-binding winged helix-turn-helix (wHTH) protein